MRSPKNSPEARLLAGLVALRLDPALATPLLKYLGELVLWNKAYNLTSVREPVEMVTRHLLDSLSILPYVAPARLGTAPVGAADGRDSFRIIDVGSGAGLPGIPLAIASPALHVTLLDSGGKKARFLRHAQRTLPLTNVEVVEARAEAYAPPQRFDTIVSRAFSALGEFLEATKALGADRGRWLAMKGKLDRKELADVPPGFRVEQEIQLQVPGLDEERHLIVVSSRGA